mmetsp:Transcript_18612/g.70402  ORF Transcript_18612/g.70402 Transcript_18612/m.70402 type:complete len:297 (-) Transcript_18612:283-1173(-)
MAIILLLIRVEMKHLLLPRRAISHGDAIAVQVLVHDERLDRAQVQSIQRVVDHEAVLAGVLVDLVEVLLQDLLLLHELDVAQGLRRQLDGLIEARLAAIADVDRLDHNAGEALVEEVGVVQVVLEVCGTGEHQTAHVGLVVRDEELHGVLGALADVVVALLEAQTCETQRGLTTTAVLLGQVDRELVHDVAHVSLQGAIKTSVTVHHDEPKALVVREQVVQRLGVELVVAEVERRVDRLERLEVNVHALLLALLRDDRAAVDHQAVRRHAVVQLEPLLRGRDRSEHREAIDATLDV